MSAYPRNELREPVEPALPDLPVFLKTPEDALGRVVLWGFTVTNKKGGKSTPAEIYALDNKKGMSNHREFLKRLEDMKKNKIKTVPLRQVLPVPPYASLPEAVRTHYTERAMQEIDYKYYRVEAVEKVNSASGDESEDEGRRGGNGGGGGEGVRRRRRRRR